MSGMHSISVSIYSQCRNAIPCKGIGIACPYLIFNICWKILFFQKPSDRFTGRSIRCNPQYISSDQLPCKIHIQIKYMLFQFFFVILRVSLTSNQSFFFCSKPDKFYTSFGLMLCKIVKSFKNHSCTRHIIISARPLRHRIIVSSYCYNFLRKFCSVNPNCYIRGFPCDPLL